MQYQAVGGSTEPSILSKDGKERHDAGEAEIKAAQAKDFAEGTADRIVGKKGESTQFPTGTQGKCNGGMIAYRLGFVS